MLLAKRLIGGPPSRAVARYLDLGRGPCAPALEALDAAAAADRSLPTRIGGMALRADLHLERRARRARLQRRAAVCAADGRGRQLWMESGLHCFLSLYAASGSSSSSSSSSAGSKSPSVPLSRASACASSWRTRSRVSSSSAPIFSSDCGSE